ncbi:trypsin-like peptidase domain-containing protein [Wenyingzhuangia marina]|uniref:Do/DeqQ family serine protease n=1 Tax=Wenyingzhuangia marina TaxID=1195760 RepID=A0A1M5VA20_9FLAO|nr:trypsin-like peptidase domain-containing protein [Wenyingzhuangia marina]GGF73452.1 serine protease [Wenyingzhuangia marina]SHH71998.1 Do/DeqQ family serine protease [Wenyingzhuangia marina]
MKQNIKLFVVALLGGFISLTLYNRLITPERQQVNQTETVNHFPVYTNNSKLVAAENSVDFTTAAEATVNAVVHVTNTSVGVQQDPFSQLFFGQGYGREYKRVGTGSGVLISPDGYIITNNHVIDNATDLEIVLNNKKRYKAELIGTDKATDIALLKIDAEDLHYITFGDSDATKIGEWALAVGNPYNLTSTVTAGIISAKGRDLEGDGRIESYIQTDAAVNPGNSGGALVNTRGELIGINTAISSQTGSFVGYSFAVPSNIAKRVVEDLMENGTVKRAVLGISTELKEDVNGVYVSEVSENTGAKKAGLQSGDIITKLDNNTIHKFSDLVGQLTAKRPGDQVLVTVNRDGITKDFKVKLSEINDMITEAFGIQFGGLSDSYKKKMNINSGLMVKKINNRGLQKLGIRPGYVILSINNQKINSLSDVEKIKSLVENEEDINKLVVVNLNGDRETFSRGW